MDHGQLLFCSVLNHPMGSKLLLSGEVHEQNQDDDMEEEEEEQKE